MDLVESLLSGSSFQGWGLLGDEFGGRMSFRRELGDVAPKSRRSGWLRLPWNGCLPCVCVLGRGGGHFIISLEETIPLEKSCCLLCSRALFRRGGRQAGMIKNRAALEVFPSLLLLRHCRGRKERIQG